MLNSTLRWEFSVDLKVSHSLLYYAPEHGSNKTNKRKKDKNLYSFPLYFQTKHNATNYFMVLVMIPYK